MNVASIKKLIIVRNTSDSLVVGPLVYALSKTERGGGVRSVIQFIASE